MHKDSKLKKIFKKIESHLHLIGATAVEDKLQEAVGETLESLRQAGIKIWVLTGDKIETAINISYSCKHFTEDMIQFSLTNLRNSDEIMKRIAQFEKE